MNLMRMREDKAWSLGFQSPLAVRLAVRLASELGRLAKRDADASKMLFGKRYYAHSVYLFQQAVEKDAKAVGLLMGMIEPTNEDLAKEVGHHSLLGILVRMPELLERLPAMQQSIRQALDKPQVRDSGLSQLLEPVLKPSPITPESVRVATRQVRSANKGLAWANTLNLSPDHPATKLVLNMLMVADQKCAEFDAAEKAITKLHALFLKKAGFSIDLDFISYALNISGRAIQELVPLAIVTMWHERETRYPPVSEKDKWDPWAYTKDKGLIKMFPEFQRHMKRLNVAVMRGAESVERDREKQNSNT